MTAPSRGAVQVLDLRGRPNGAPPGTSGRVVVLDDAATLVDHWDTYLELAGNWLVSGVLCVAVGERGHAGATNGATSGVDSSVVLRVPAVLTNEKGAVLWVGDEDGVEWAPRSDHAAPVTRGGVLAGLDELDGAPRMGGLQQLMLALHVEEVFDAVRDRVRERPNRAASPGLEILSARPTAGDEAAALDAARAELTTGRSERRVPVELRQALASLGVNPRLQTGAEATGELAAARATLSEAYETADYLAGAVGSRWLFRARAVPALTASGGTRAVRPGPDLAEWTGRAARAAADYREKAWVLLNRIDGQLRRGDTTAAQVVEAGAPVPTQVSATEVAGDLAAAVAQHLAHDPALPMLATHLQREAAAQAPAGCPEEVAQLRDAGGPDDRGVPPGWPVSWALFPVVLLTCAVAVYFPSPHWLGWILGVVALLAWFVPAWLLLARWPMDDGERGLASAAASTALGFGLPGLAGIGLGLLGIRYLGAVPVPASWRTGFVIGAFLVVAAAVQLSWSLAAYRVRKAVDLRPLGAELDEVTGLVGRVLRDEWVPSARRRLVAAALNEVADGLYEIERSLAESPLFDHHDDGAAPVALPDGVARAVPGELQVVVRDDLVWLVRAILDRARSATESGNPAHEGEYRRRATTLLGAYAAHLRDSGLLTVPVFDDLREPAPDPGARDRLLTQVWSEAPRARRTLRMRDTERMRQLCSGRQLGDLSMYDDSVTMVRFAPLPLRRIDARAAPGQGGTEHLGETVWTRRAELVGVVRLIDLQARACEVVQTGIHR